MKRYGKTVHMRLALLLLALPLAAQTPTAVAPANLPKVVLSTGGGFASPGGAFSYISESSLVLPQGTYATVSQEYTLLHGQVQSCTFAGVSKPMYQFSVFTIGVTGLGGGCTSSSGATNGAGSGQGFLHIRWGKLAFGNILTASKNTVGGYKVTLGFSWSQ